MEKETKNNRKAVGNYIIAIFVAIAIACFIRLAITKPIEIGKSTVTTTTTVIIDKDTIFSGSNNRDIIVDYRLPKVIQQDTMFVDEGDGDEYCDCQ